MKPAHHLTVQNGLLMINGQDSVALADQFQSYKKALTAWYPKVQVLFAAKDNGNLATMERPAWQR